MYTMINFIIRLQFPFHKIMSSHKTVRRQKGTLRPVSLNATDPKANANAFEFIMNRRAVGRVVVQRHTRGKKAGQTYLYNVHINEAFRGQGLCKVMMHQVLQKLNVPKVYLEVERRNIAAWKCYNATGFVPSRDDASTKTRQTVELWARTKRTYRHKK